MADQMRGIFGTGSQWRDGATDLSVTWRCLCTSVSNYKAQPDGRHCLGAALRILGMVGTEKSAACVLPARTGVRCDLQNTHTQFLHLFQNNWNRLHSTDKHGRDQTLGHQDPLVRCQKRWKRDESNGFQLGSWKWSFIWRNLERNKALDISIRVW